MDFRRRRASIRSLFSLNLVFVVFSFFAGGVFFAMTELDHHDESIGMKFLFRPSPTQEPYHCSCIHCTTDPNCGGLWDGEARNVDVSKYVNETIHIVISHCLHPLDWISRFMGTTPVKSITVISKCNHQIEGLPVALTDVTILRLPNVGRCDHSYAHWINKNYFVNTESTDVVIFLKDERTEESIHQAGMWKSLEEMLMTTYTEGFSCGLRPTMITREAVFWLSAFHDTEILKTFATKVYDHKSDVYGSMSQGLFESRFKNMAEWLDFLGADLPSDLTQACYGGTFAARMRNIRLRDKDFWAKLELSLSRGNSIEEGHFAERAWAGLIATPLTGYKAHLLRNASCGVANYSDSYVGTLKRHYDEPIVIF
jgi:hypothetical protein